MCNLRNCPFLSRPDHKIPYATFPAAPPDGISTGTPLIPTIVGTGPSFEAGSAQPLFVAQLGGSGIVAFSSQYAVASDGRFLLYQPAPDVIAPITLIINSPMKK